MRLGYNTNGTVDHRWRDAIELMAEIGYESVAITVDHHCLDPFSPRLNGDVVAVRELLQRHGLTSVIETGARYLLNPRVKHEPTLMSATEKDRSIRIDFLRRCIDIAAELGSQAVSFWSGILREQITRETAMDRLADGCRQVCDHAAEKSIRLAFEPEPGMFIETMEQYGELLERMGRKPAGVAGADQRKPAAGAPSGGCAPKTPLRPQPPEDETGFLRHFGLTIDIGHLQCVEEEPIPVHLRRWADRLYNVHIEDMRRGVHEHLPFGEGEIDFPPVLHALREIGYTGGVHVELSRHSHAAPRMMRESYRFLRGLIDGME